MMTRIVTALTLVVGMAVVPARAFAADGQPEKLSDAQLDDVTGGAPPAFVLAAGHGPPWMHNQTPTVQNIGTQVNFSIQDVYVTFNVGSNSDVNLAAALQLSLLSQQPQAASATAVQSASAFARASFAGW